MSMQISVQGLHPTTELCLEALQFMHESKDFQRILDMGCGNGILSIAAASIWNAKVLAVDIAPKAINDTRQMVQEHQLEDMITVERSDGFANPLINMNSPYDLILFNMLAEPIINMASQVKKLSAPKTTLILSGILSWEVEAVQNTYKALGFEFIKEFVNNPWYGFIVCHKTDI